MLVTLIEVWADWSSMSQNLWPSSTFDGSLSSVCLSGEPMPPLTDETGFAIFKQQTNIASLFDVSLGHVMEDVRSICFRCGWRGQDRETKKMAAAADDDDDADSHPICSCLLLLVVVVVEWSLQWASRWIVEQVGVARPRKSTSWFFPHSLFISHFLFLGVAGLGATRSIQDSIDLTLTIWRGLSWLTSSSQRCRLLLSPPLSLVSSLFLSNHFSSQILIGISVVRHRSRSDKPAHLASIFVALSLLLLLNFCCTRYACRHPRRVEGEHRKQLINWRWSF